MIQILSQEANNVPHNIYISNSVLSLLDIFPQLFQHAQVLPTLQFELKNTIPGLASLYQLTLYKYI